MLSSESDRKRAVGVTTNLGQTGKQFQYVPILKAKSGELEALSNLQPNEKLRIFPIFQIMSKVSATFATDLNAAWAGLPVALDGAFRSASDSSALAFTALFNLLGNAGVAVIPVIDVGAVGPYPTAVAAALNLYGPGLVLRVPLELLGSAAQWLGQFGYPTQDTDLLIDAGHVADFSPGLLAPVVIGALQQNAATLPGWRSVTLVSSSAPKDAGSLNPGPNVVPRRCWQLWNAVAPSFPELHFGDHGVLHRDLTEPPGYAMANATVTPRYALPNDWFIRKGVTTRGVRGQHMTVQYHGHAQALIAHASFGPMPGCWGDQRIQQIAGQAGVGSSGNRETWVSIAFNRHASVVCNHLP
ncbi:beta family protein [Methylobacterium sp. J-059]|uniref:beta family protein n=1 Tax=Methylobacterium sp. J-059 TaxID=2836643 RepID=UPI001FBA2341|nr:beta family protein [Methylobacterium sp. J-059]MCJ2042919.1 beta family protein [Methylobacterium sp. J-059]